ncbi:MAG TPA: hypothetical protein VFG79_05945, partial [Solirubrobacter sp.]|nr:hypothetical protein [Solirubrobacter sp.]
MLTGFLVSASIATPIVGKLGDLYGKGRVLTAVMTLAAGDHDGDRRRERERGARRDKRQQHGRRAAVHAASLGLGEPAGEVGEGRLDLLVHRAP